MIDKVYCGGYIWDVEEWNINELHNNPKNPGKITKSQQEKLIRSIKKFGLCEPIVVNLDGMIIEGHQRFQALKKLKYKKVRVMVPNTNISDKEAEELRLMLNKNKGEWNYDIILDSSIESYGKGSA
jgi:ParB-like chromosome segregation protein Spo0J